MIMIIITPITKMIITTTNIHSQGLAATIAKTKKSATSFTEEQVQVSSMVKCFSLLDRICRIVHTFPPCLFAG